MYLPKVLRATSSSDMANRRSRETAGNVAEGDLGHLGYHPSHVDDSLLSAQAQLGLDGALIQPGCRKPGEVDERQLLFI